MKKYYNARELTGMPGLPDTEQSIRRMARRQNWKHQPHKGLGGGQEFHIFSLPMETRAALAAKIVEQPKPKSKTDPKIINKQELAHALRELAAIQQQQEKLLSESLNLVKTLLSVMETDR